MLITYFEVDHQIHIHKNGKWKECQILDHLNLGIQNVLITTFSVRMQEYMIKYLPADKNSSSDRFPMNIQETFCEFIYV